MHTCTAYAFNSLGKKNSSSEDIPDFHPLYSVSKKFKICETKIKVF